MWTIFPHIVRVLSCTALRRLHEDRDFRLIFASNCCFVRFIELFDALFELLNVINLQPNYLKHIRAEGRNKWEWAGIREFGKNPHLRPTRTSFGSGWTKFGSNSECIRIRFGRHLDRKGQRGIQMASDSDPNEITRVSIYDDPTSNPTQWTRREEKS